MINLRNFLNLANNGNKRRNLMRIKILYCEVYLPLHLLVSSIVHNGENSMLTTLFTSKNTIAFIHNQNLFHFQIEVTWPRTASGTTPPPCPTAAWTSQIWREKNWARLFRRTWRNLWIFLERPESREWLRHWDCCVSFRSYLRCYPSFSCSRFRKHQMRNLLNIRWLIFED